MLAPMEVSLRAGDVLYIPPYWWHRASVPLNASDSSNPQSKSMSVAAYTASDAMSMYNIFKAHPVPISPEWTHDQQVAGLHEYICAVSALFVEEEDSHDCARWVRGILAQRFDPLLVNEDTSDFAIGEGWSSMVLKQRRIFLWLTRPLDMPAMVGKQLRAHAQRLQLEVERIQRRDGEWETAVIETEKASLVEDVVNLVLGTRFVEPFLRKAAGGLVLWSAQREGTV